MTQVAVRDRVQHQDGDCHESDIKTKRESSQASPSDRHASQSPPMPRTVRTVNANMERLREAVYVRYLLEDFVLSPSRDTRSGWLALLLPELYAAAAEDSTLKLAVRAAAWAYLGNRQAAPELQIQAREMHCRCLKALASDLTSLEVATSSSTCTAVLVLGLYECIAGNDSTNFWHSHGQGLSLLMNLRSSKTCRELPPLPVEESPDGMIICQMQRRNLDLRISPSPEEGTYIKNLDGTKPVNQLFGAAFQCSHVVARAHEEVLKADGTPASVTRLEKVVTEIRTFDTTLVRLFRSCVTVSPTDRCFTEAEAQSQWLMYCPTYRAMAMWIFLKASRIILHQLRLECLEKLLASRTEASESLAVITDSSDAIILAVNYMTDSPNPSSRTPPSRGPKNIGGYYLLWPLHTVVECKPLDKARQGRARDALLRIGDRMCLNHALEIAKAVE